MYTERKIILIQENYLFDGYLLMTYLFELNKIFFLFLDHFYPSKKNYFEAKKFYLIQVNTSLVPT